MTGIDDILHRLRTHWRGLGCAALPPCTLDVPMALMHPQTVMRLLDDEPWRAVCAQPVTRPGDARSGRHPFRTSRHLQLHVVLKAPPLRALRGWLLDSLEALGLRADAHEIRFVDQHQRVEALDAEGVGWRVLVDGLSVCRLTVWQRFAGRHPAAPPADLVYGVERLTLPVVDLDDVFRLPWSEGDAAPSYLRLRRRAEEEAGRYAAELADVDWLRTLLDGLAAEATRCLDAGLLRPAYEHMIQTLVHLDVLARRDALEPRERASRLEAVRRTVAAIADAVAPREAETVPGGARDAAPEAAEEPAEVSTQESAEVSPDEPAPGEPAPDETVPAPDEPAPAEPAPAETESENTAAKPARKKPKRPPRRRSKSTRGKADDDA